MPDGPRTWCAWILSLSRDGGLRPAREPGLGDDRRAPGGHRDRGAHGAVVGGEPVRCAEQPDRGGAAAVPGARPGDPATLAPAAQRPARCGDHADRVGAGEPVRGGARRRCARRCHGPAGGVGGCTHPAGVRAVRRRVHVHDGAGQRRTAAHRRHRLGGARSAVDRAADRPARHPARAGTEPARRARHRSGGALHGRHREPTGPRHRGRTGAGPRRGPPDVDASTRRGVRGRSSLRPRHDRG